MNKLYFVILISFTKLSWISSAPVMPINQAEIVNFINEPYAGGDGYYFQYQTSDGQVREERGQLLTLPDIELIILRITGSYSVVDSETGKAYLIKYTADENGFQSSKEELPQRFRMRLNH